MENVIVYAQGAAEVIGALAILATFVVRLIPKSSANEKVNSVVQKIHKLFAYLPTLGINPKTKQLLGQLAEEQAQFPSRKADAA